MTMFSRTYRQPYTRQLTDQEKRERGYQTTNHVETVDVKLVPWGLLHADRKREIKNNRRGIVAGILAFTAIFGTRGNVSDPVSVPQQREKVTTELVRDYRGQTIYDQFVQSYIQPQGYLAPREKNGNGWLGLFSQGAETNIQVQLGQKCLAGTAFDITDSKIRGRARGDLSAVASLTVNTDGVASIHPAGSNADPLVFEIENGVLANPTPGTVETLYAHGCDEQPITYIESEPDGIINYPLLES